MPGIRIRHDTKRNVLMTLVDGSRPYREPLICVVCHKVHTFKTYHFHLDAVGSAIVSFEIAERLKRMHADLQGFTIGEVVANPPAQRLIIGGPVEHAPIVEHPTLREPT